MGESLESLKCLTDDDLIVRVDECVAREREATALLLAALSELDVRRLYLGRGYGSLFDYCTRHLHFSERAAYGRIAAARLARRFPIILDLIADSRLSLTAVSLLAKYLNETNHRVLLEEATYKTAAEVEVIVARLAPRPDVPPRVRRMRTPDPSPISLPVARAYASPEGASVSEAASAPSQPLPLSRAVLKPLAPERFKVQFTISGETREKLKAAQDLLRHSVPTGDIAAVFERALNALLSELERTKMAIVARPRSKPRAVAKGSRVIPAAIRRAVWARDKGRCAFVGNDGRCRERGGLELHHVLPFAAGGKATVENIELRCRAHNAHEADVYFGPARDP